MNKSHQVWHAMGWIVIGTLLGVISTVAVAKSGVEDIAKQSQSCAEQLRDINQASTQALNRLNDENSVATVLYEQDAPSLNGLVGLLSGRTLPAQAGMQPRWFIPIKVKPTLYGDPSSVRIFYIDKEGRTQGPIAPEVLTR